MILITSACHTKKTALQSAKALTTYFVEKVQHCHTISVQHLKSGTVIEVFETDTRSSELNAMRLWMSLLPKISKKEI